jgi:chemotaxis protein methyltransferase CheR
MTDQDFDVVRRLLHARSAIALDDGKQYLVESRLAPILRQRKLDSLSDLVALLRRERGGEIERQVVEALVTTESSFFRDLHPFESLRKVVLPDLINRRRDSRRLDIWCAATAHGQEPYSVALLIREHFPELATWKINLLATDISREALARAREGVYNQIEVNRGLPASLMLRYFEQHGTHWRIFATIRDMVEFRELNLAAPWPNLPPMDLVLLRNVLIYFDIETKKTIFGRLTRVLRPDGYLLLGGSETTFNLDNSYRRVEPLKSGFYQLKLEPG